MAETHMIMERKDLGDDSIKAVPKSLYHEGVDRVYAMSGSVSGLESADFREHSHWGFKYIPVQCAGSLQESSEAAKDAVKKGLEAVCETQGLNFDQARLLNNLAITSQVLDYELVGGNIYLVRFSGKALSRDNKDITLSVAYFLAPQDGEIHLDGNQLLLEGKPINLPKGDLQYVVESDSYDGTLEAFKVGSATIHRKNLKPYSSTGTYGSEHSNGPWIVLADDVDQKRLDFLAQRMKLE